MMEQTYGAFHSQSEERLERDIAQSTQAAEAKMADEKRQAEENWASIDRSQLQMQALHSSINCFTCWSCFLYLA